MSVIQTLLSNPYKELSSLPKKYLLIDTNFLIDALRYPSEFNKLLEKFNNSGFILVSIQAALIEFVKGSKSFKDYSKKVDFYKSVVSQMLPLEPKIYTNVNDITRVLLKKGGQLSYVDCLLLGITMKYKDSMYFLTKDRSDVPLSLFNPVAGLMVETPDNNCTFYLYEYKEELYKELLLKILEDRLNP